VVQATVNVPLSLDSANPQALEAGLQEIEGKPLINSVTAEEEKLRTVIPLAKKYGAALIGLPLDEKGIPETPEGRLKLGEKILQRVISAGIPRQDLYLDGLTLAVSADSKAPEITLKTIRLFKEKLGVKTVLGVSNVSFGLPRRADINATFLTLALHAGLDLPIVNPYSEEIQQAILLSDLLNGRDAKARRFLSEVGTTEARKKIPMETGEKPLSQQLFDAILFGNREDVVTILDKTLKSGMDPLKINDEILSPAMIEVGSRYNKKQFFLPQVIMAAEAMHAAFSALKPHLRTEVEKAKGTVILATVKGDVHDIGKNIVATLVENNGYRVIDLGKNVGSSEIIQRLEGEKVDVVGLSALMTTTMEVMRTMVKEIKASKKVKIIVGGAVVTRNFADEIGADGYGKDATEAVKEIDRLLHNSQG
jgi:5-methyltetrahydrofolate--homocysteine methyltransferase